MIHIALRSRRNIDKTPSTNFTQNAPKLRYVLHMDRCRTYALLYISDIICMHHTLHSKYDGYIASSKGGLLQCSP